MQIGDIPIERPLATRREKEMKSESLVNELKDVHNTPENTEGTKLSAEKQNINNESPELGPIATEIKLVPLESKTRKQIEQEIVKLTEDFDKAITQPTALKNSKESNENNSSLDNVDSNSNSQAPNNSSNNLYENKTKLKEIQIRSKYHFTKVMLEYVTLFVMIVVIGVIIGRYKICYIVFHIPCSI